MKKYHVCYRSKTDGDCTTVWVLARDEKEAAEVVSHEYWDVGSIIEIYQ